MTALERDTGQEVPLSSVPMGCTCRVTRLLVSDHVRRRLLDIGLVPATTVTAVRRSAAGDPTAYLIRGALIALRREQASKVMVQVCPRQRPPVSS
ncbi:MAG: FeoA family protein [Bacillota bacterium]